jgi:hypothetical protein
MRNYFLMFWAVVAASGTNSADPSQDFGPNDAIWTAGRTPDERDELVRKYKAIFAGLFPPPDWTITFSQPRLFAAYHCLDKSEFQNLVSSFGGVSDAMYGLCFNFQPPMFATRVREEGADGKPTNSPRSTSWTDADGVSRKAGTKGVKAGAQSLDGLLQLLIGRMATRRPPRLDLVQALGRILQQHLKCEGALRGQKRVDKVQQQICDIAALTALGKLQQANPGVFSR